MKANSFSIVQYGDAINSCYGPGYECQSHMPQFWHASQQQETSSYARKSNHKIVSGKNFHGIAFSLPMQHLSPYYESCGAGVLKN